MIINKSNRDHTIKLPVAYTEIYSLATISLLTTGTDYPTVIKSKNTSSVIITIDPSGNTIHATNVYWITIGF